MRQGVFALLSIVSFAGAEQVVFNVPNVDARAVSVAGEFNGWSPSALALTRDEDDVWTGAADVPPGSYGYKLVVDGEWLLDPGNAEVTVIDGVVNSLLTVGTGSSPDLLADQPNRPRTWTSRKGTTVEATLERFEGSSVSLLTGDGRSLLIRIADLDPDDQAYLADEYRKQQERTRKAATAEQFTIERNSGTGKLFQGGFLP